MRQPLANRKKCKPQTEYEKTQSRDDEQGAEKQRAQATYGLIKDKNLKNADHRGDRQQVTEAVACIPGKCGQWVFHNIRLGYYSLIVIECESTPMLGHPMIG